MLSALEQVLALLPWGFALCCILYIYIHIYYLLYDEITTTTESVSHSATSLATSSTAITEDHSCVAPDYFSSN